MVFESFSAIDKHDRNFCAINRLQGGILFYINDPQLKPWRFRTDRLPPWLHRTNDSRVWSRSQFGCRSALRSSPSALPARDGFFKRRRNFCARFTSFMICVRNSAGDSNFTSSRSLRKVETRCRRVCRNSFVQDERFDCHLFSSNVGPNTNIRHTIQEGSFIQRNFCDVDAVPGYQLVLRFEIQRRNSHRSPPAGAFNELAFDFNPPAKQAARARYCARGYELPDARTRGQSIREHGRLEPQSRRIPR